MSEQDHITNITPSKINCAESIQPPKSPFGRYVLLIIVVAAVIATIWFFTQGNGSQPQTEESETLNFAEVVITDLIQEEEFNGVLGSIEDDPITSQLIGTITAIAEKGDTVNQGEQLFSISNQPVILMYGHQPAYRDIAIGEDIITLSSQQNGTITWIADQGTVIEQGDVLFRVDDQPVVALYGVQPAYRSIAMVASNDQTVDISSQLNGTITWVPESGTTIQQGEVLFRVNDQPVILMYGEQPAYRDLYNVQSYTPSEATLTQAQAQVTFTANELAEAEAAYQPYRNKPDSDLNKAYYGTQWANAKQAYDSAVLQLNYLTGASSDPSLTGADVLQLENALVAMGYDADENLVPDDTFFWETANAVLDFQEAAGMETDGIIDLGEVVFLPGPAQVLDIYAVSGDYSGGMVLNLSVGNQTSGTDVLQLQHALIELGYDHGGALNSDGLFTPETTQAVMQFQADYGFEPDGIVDFGEIVFLPGPSQILEQLSFPGYSAGGSILTISTGDAANGEDILALEEAFVSLGFDAEGTLEADGIYTPETNQAVLAFQAALGLEIDGIINLGEIFFLPGSVRITSQLSNNGSSVGVGSPILGISLTEKVVFMDLPANNQGALSIGDPVMIEMPDNALVPATVIFVSKTATPQDYAPATFEVHIQLDDPTAAEGLDQAPVDVIVVSDSVEDVMAIPVTALLALLEGGYAVELDIGGDNIQLIGIEVGFFGSDNLIEIVAGELQPGDQVVIP